MRASTTGNGTATSEPYVRLQAIGASAPGAGARVRNNDKERNHVKATRIALSALAVAAIAGAASPGISSAGVGAAKPKMIKPYDHIIEIMMENTSYGTIIGNSNAPFLNSLATKYGLATNYYGVTHPSEPNYVAAVGGDYFGIQDDNQFYCTVALAATDPNCAGTTVNHTITSPSLADQLTAAGKSWKGYFQSLPPTPPAGQLVMTGPTANGPYTFKWPSSSVALYASKHNPFVNFTGTQADTANMVPDNQLAADAATGSLPTYGLVVPDQCHDMHGTGTCSDPTQLIQLGDTYVSQTVSTIMASKQWKKGHNAIVVTWDEDDFSDSGAPGTGCCGSNVGGGHVATIVVDNKGKTPITDATAYNHYSLLGTMEAAFGLPPLAHAGDSVVPQMVPLFRP